MTSKESLTAPAILARGAKALLDRAASRDQPDGERSMARAVEMFNAYAGGDRRMSETDGWMFMVFLKAARAAQGKVNEDDYVDGAAYFALAGERAVRGGPEPATEETTIPLGWTAWCEGFQIPSGLVEVRLHDGTLLDGPAETFRWSISSHCTNGLDIVAYRHIEPR